MADPLSVIAGVAALVTTSLKTLKTFNDYKTRYQLVDPTIISMRAQCACVEMALHQVQATLLENHSSAHRLRADLMVAKTFDSVFSACNMAFLILNERLQAVIDTEVNERGEMTRTARLKNVLHDTEMQELLQNIQGQASGLGVLLGALQMTSNTEMHTLLQNRQSASILRKVEENARTLAINQDTKSIKAPPPVSFYSGPEEIEFDFDFEIINTTAYRRVFASSQRAVVNIDNPNLDMEGDASTVPDCKLNNGKKHRTDQTDSPLKKRQSTADSNPASNPLSASSASYSSETLQVNQATDENSSELTTSESSSKAYPETLVPEENLGKTLETESEVEDRLPANLKTGCTLPKSWPVSRPNDFERRMFRFHGASWRNKADGLSSGGTPIIEAAEVAQELSREQLGDRAEARSDGFSVSSSAAERDLGVGESTTETSENGQDSVQVENVSWGLYSTIGSFAYQWLQTTFGPKKVDYQMAFGTNNGG